MKDKKVAKIHQDLTGNCYITDDSMDYLSTNGNWYSSSRRAIMAAREDIYREGWTHYRTVSNQ